MENRVFRTVKERRSIRSFKQEKVPRETLNKIIKTARLYPSASNKQPLEFIIVDENEKLKKVFSTLSWAGNVDWNPGENEMPQAYIIILANKDINPNYKHDSGIAANTISILAKEEKLGSCILGSIDREKLSSYLQIPNKYIIDLVIALGYPNHKSRIEEFEGEGETGYWRDKKGNFHIPKKELDSILHYNNF